MMQRSFAKNYIKIYAWQGLSMCLNFISMFIVVPFLTADPTVYGIYSLTISFSIFFSYADLGFLSAGQKYASESFAKGDLKDEMNIIGFTNFILGLFLILASIVFGGLSFKPELIVKGLETSEQSSIASQLLIILAIFTPVTFFQRLVQMIFGIRMEDYLVQRTNIIGNIIKISSVLWFFRDGSYDIVGYFLFSQFINLIASVYNLLLAHKRYNYNLKLLIRSVRYSKWAFDKTKGLAFTSLFLTVSWILYYELDSLFIGRFLGATQVGIYAIGLTILGFFRSLLGVLFAPFSVRFNHFVGIGDEDGLKLFTIRIISLLAPFVVLPIVTIGVLAEPFTLAWVGKTYTNSIVIVQILIFCNVFAFVTYPVGSLLMAKVRQKEMYLIAFLLPVIYYVGILCTINTLGVKSFAIFKLVAFLVSFVVYYRILLKELGMSFSDSIGSFFKPLLLPLILSAIVAFAVKDYLPHEKSKSDLLLIGGVMTMIITTGISIQFISSIQWRSQINYALKQIRGNVG